MSHGIDHRGHGHPSVGPTAARAPSRSWLGPDLKRGSFALGFLALVLLTGCADPFARSLIEEGPVIGEGRIERPAAGYVIELPDGWTAREINPELALNRFGLRPQEFDLGGRLDIWIDPPSWKYGCYVHVDESAAEEEGASAGGYAELSMRRLRSDAGEVGDVSRSMVELPAGEAHHIELTYRHGGSGSEYIIARDRVVYAVGCFSPDLHGFDQEWRSVADGFGFVER